MNFLLLKRHWQVFGTSAEGANPAPPAAIAVSPDGSVVAICEARAGRRTSPLAIMVSGVVVVIGVVEVWAVMVAFWCRVMLDLDSGAGMGAGCGRRNHHLR